MRSSEEVEADDSGELGLYSDGENSNSCLFTCDGPTSETLPVLPRLMDR